MTRNERIKFILEKKNIGYEKVAEILKVTKQAIGNRLNREKEIDDKSFIDAIVELTQVDRTMILTGEGFKDFVFTTNYDLVLEEPAGSFPIGADYNSYKEAFYNQRDQKLELEKRTSEQEQIINSLKMEVEYLKAALLDKDHIIREMKEKEILMKEKLEGLIKENNKLF